MADQKAKSGVAVVPGKTVTAKKKTVKRKAAAPAKNTQFTEFATEVARLVRSGNGKTDKLHKIDVLCKVAGF